MMRALRIAVLLLVACEGTKPPKKAPATENVPPVASVEEADVFLRYANDRVEIVARGVHEIHGVAFRLRWDPESVAIGTSHPSELWSKSALAMTKEVSAGELAGVWTERGPTGALQPAGEVVLGWLELTRKSAASTRLELVPTRCKVIDAKGVALATRFRGVTLDATSP